MKSRPQLAFSQGEPARVWSEGPIWRQSGRSVLRVVERKRNWDGEGGRGDGERSYLRGVICRNQSHMGESRRQRRLCLNR